MSTAPTLRALALAAYSEREERHRPERDAYRAQKISELRGALSHLIGSEPTDHREEWDEDRDEARIIVDGLAFYSLDAADGVALETPDGKRHRIYSLATLGEVLQRIDDDTADVVYRLQHLEETHGSNSAAKPRLRDGSADPGGYYSRSSSPA